MANKAEVGKVFRFQLAEEVVAALIVQPEAQED
jgi:hypothetical protein